MKAGRASLLACLLSTAMLNCHAQASSQTIDADLSDLLHREDLGDVVPSLQKDGVNTFKSLLLLTDDDVDSLVQKHLFNVTTSNLLKAMIASWKGDRACEKQLEAAKVGDKVAVKLSLSAVGACRDYWDDATPLHWAAKVGHEQVVKTLLEAGADVNAKDMKHGETPLHWSAQMGRHGSVRVLMEGGAFVNAKDADQETPLHEMARNGHKVEAYKVVLSLVEGGADVNATDKDDTTPLHLAAGEGVELLAMALLKSGAGVNAKDKDETTPLHWAAAEDQRDMVVSLVEEWGADVNAQDKHGRTPVDVSTDKRTRKLLRNFGGRGGADGDEL